MAKVTTGPEKISLSLSAIAIILAAISIYYQFFHVSQELKVSALNFGFQGNTISTRLALINAGNREALITDIYAVRSAADGTFRGLGGPVKTPEGVPTVIKPSEILIITVTTDCEPAFFFDTAEPLESADYDVTRRVRVALGFSFMDSNGVQYASTVPFSEIDIQKDKIVASQYKSKTITLLKQ